MFDQLKDLYHLKKQAEELQKQMGQERFTATAGLVTVIINGNQELEDVQISSGEDLDPARLAHDIKSAFSQAQSQMKQAMAEKFRGMN